MDGIGEWTWAQRRVIELVGPLSAGAAEIRVPACPDWTVRDLLSHMVGLGADVVGGDEPDDHNDAWTGRQVEQRRGLDVAALVAEWQALADPLRSWMRDNGTRPVNDAVIHEQDLRGALGVPGAQDTPALAALRDRFASRFGDRLDGLAPIALVGDTWRWSSADGPAAVVVEAPDFELGRALISRRSAAQIRAWTTRGDVGPYLHAFATLGSLPSADLSESVSGSG